MKYIGLWINIVTCNIVKLQLVTWSNDCLILSGNHDKTFLDKQMDKVLKQISDRENKLSTFKHSETSKIENGRD